MTLTTAPIQFKYINLLPLGGRGGVTRFFMLSQGIPFEEELINPGDDWAAEKKRLVESGENPSGSAPILYIARTVRRTHNTLLYRATSHASTSWQDLVADEYQTWRNQWVQVTFMGTDEDKVEYKVCELINQLTKFDAFYKTLKTEKDFLSISATTGNPLWGDAAVYSLLRDHILTGYTTLDNLKAYPNLAALYTTYESIPAIQKWLVELVAAKKDWSKHIRFMSIALRERIATTLTMARHWKFYYLNKCKTDVFLYGEVVSTSSIFASNSNYPFMVGWQPEHLLC